MYYRNDYNVNGDFDNYKVILFDISQLQFVAGKPKHQGPVSM